MGVNQVIFKADFICKNVIPGGDINCSNLVFTTPDTFVEGSLEVFLDGSRLEDSLDYAVNPTNSGFTLILDPSDSNRLKLAPQSQEKLTVNYIKKCS